MFRVFLTSDTSFGKMLPDFTRVAEVVLIIPVSSVAAECEFSLQNRIKMPMRNRLCKAKMQNLMTITSALSLNAFDKVIMSV